MSVKLKEKNSKNVAIVKKLTLLMHFVKMKTWVSRTEGYKVTVFETSNIMAESKKWSSY